MQQTQLHRARGAHLATIWTFVVEVPSAYVLQKPQSGTGRIEPHVALAN